MISGRRHFIAVFAKQRRVSGDLIGSYHLACDGVNVIAAIREIEVTSYTVDFLRAHWRNVNDEAEFIIRVLQAALLAFMLQAIFAAHAYFPALEKESSRALANLPAIDNAVVFSHLRLLSQPPPVLTRDPFPANLVLR